MIRKYQEVYSHMLKNHIVVLSPFLSIEEMMERKQQVADWLVKKGDLMIQKAHMFWCCVCSRIVWIRGG